MGADRSEGADSAGTAGAGTACALLEAGAEGSGGAASDAANAGVGATAGAAADTTSAIASGRT